MASLTPLSKGLIALAVLGGMASAVWHLGLKEKLSDLKAGQATPASSTAVGTPSATAIPAEPAPAAPGSTKSPTAEPANASPKLVESGAPARPTAAQNTEMGRKLMDLGNFAQARPHLEAAVKAGDGGAACHLGEMTLKGQGGLAANQEQAAKLFQLAQSRGSICFASGQ